MMKPVESTPRARRTAVNARKQQKSMFQTKVGRSNGVASEHEPQNGQKGEQGRRYAATTGAQGPDPLGRGTAGLARRRGGGAGKLSPAGALRGAIPAAKLTGEPRCSIVVLETTSAIKATERDARRDGRPTASTTPPDLVDLEMRIKASHHRCGLLARKSEKLARERIVAAKETGDLLIQLRSVIVHGNWQT
jgi:hypothetical protein